MRGMGEEFSTTPRSYESYSPTRRAGWGLSPRLSTVELVPLISTSLTEQHYFQRAWAPSDNFELRGFTSDVHWARESPMNIGLRLSK